MKRRYYVLLLGLLAAGLSFQPASGFVSGPIVQGLTETGATLLLHDAGASGAVLQYRGERERAWRRARFERRGATLACQLRGLESGRRYSYQVQSERGTARYDGSFRTAPLSGTGEARFTVIGDSGALPWWIFLQDIGLEPRPFLRGLLPSRAGQGLLARRMLEGSPDFVLHVGDIVYPKGERKHYRDAVFVPFAPLLARAAFYPTVGNHDAITAAAAPMLEAFHPPGRETKGEGRYYDFHFGPLHVFCLATYTRPFSAGSPQYRWLEDGLRRSKSPWKVVFTHRPFQTASRSRRDKVTLWLGRVMHEMLAKHGVRLVFSGHDHVYERYKERDGIHYFVVGGGGKSIYALHEDPRLAVSRGIFSFVEAHATPSFCELRARDSRGVVFDHLKLVRRQGSGR